MNQCLKILLNKLIKSPFYAISLQRKKEGTNLTGLLLIATILINFHVARSQVQDTSFYSPSLDRTINVDVYLPPGYTSSIDTLYPVIYFLHGWGGSENSASLVMGKAEELINAGTIDPLIIVCPNNSPAPFNGSFYVNSITSGAYEDFHISDLIPWIDSTYRTSDQKAYRGIMGQSMGGYGGFRYSLLYDSLFRAFAAHASPLNFELAKEEVRTLVLQEHPAGAPYTYDYENDGDVTKMIFAMAGAFSPNPTSPQTYINPQIVEFPLDEDGNIIDSIYQKWQEFDILSYLGLLTPDDSVAIFFGAGQNDELALYDPNVALQDTLDDYGLDYTFFDHAGTHAMPELFREEALVFLDSVMADPLFSEGCPNPSDLYVSDISDTSALLGWTENGSATAWQIAIDTAGFDTTGVVPLDVVLNPFSHTSLTPGYTYDWYVRSSCDDGFFSDWIGPLTFQTYPDTLRSITLPWVENWENTTSDTNKYSKQFYRSDSVIWTFEAELEDENRVRWGTSAYQYRYGSGALTLDKFPNTGFYSQGAAIVTLNLADYIGSTDLELSFWYSDHGDETNSEDRVWIRGSDSDNWITIYYLDPGKRTDNVYSFVAGLDIDAALSSATPPQTVSETFQVKFVQKGKTFTAGDGISFDNIMVSTCATPSNQTVSNIGVTSAQLNWQANGSETQWQLRFDTTGFDTTGVTPLVISTNPYLVSNLDTNTMYDWYIRAYCSEGDTSAWIGPNTFTTWRFVRKAPFMIYPGVNTQMQFQWQLSSTSPSTIEWGTDTTYGMSFETSEYGDDHQHLYTLTGLTPSTKYYYRVTVGPEVFSGSFVSAPPENQQPYSIYAYGDSRTLTQRHDSVAASILNNLQEDTASQTILLSSGDLVTNGDVDAQWDDDFFSDRYPNIREMLSILPFQSAMGNHEESGILFAKFFPYPFVDGRYWSYDYGEVHIAVIDQYTDYSLGSDQYNWLVNDLSATTKKWKIVLLHEPGWHAGPQNNFYVKTTIHNLCRDNGVQFVIAGHNHNYVHCLVEGVHHVTSGGGGSPLYDVNFAYDSIVFATKQLHFTKFNFVGDTCTVFAINVDNDTIDRFDVDLSPCFGPSDLTVKNITQSTADLSWTENGEAMQWQLMIDTMDFDTTGFTPQLVSDNPFTVTGLLSSTDYDYYVRSYCGEGDSSAWAGPVSFKTLCDAISVEIYENFDLAAPDSLPGCWAAIASDTIGFAGIIDTVSYSPSNAFMLYNDSLSNGFFALVSAPLSDLGAQTNQLRFRGRTLGDTATIIIGTIADRGDAASFNPMDTVVMSDQFNEHIVVFDDYSGTDQMLVFRHGMDSAAYLLIDDIYWEEKPYLMVNTTDTSAGLLADTVALYVSSNNPWSVSETASWFSAQPANGYLDDTLTVIYETNTSGHPRMDSILLSSPGIAQDLVVYISQTGPHYETVWLNNPYQSMLIKVDSLFINELDINPGCEIGVFDKDSLSNEYCIGVGVITEPLSEINPLFIILSADDPTTDTMDGFIQGNEIIFKFWQPEVAEECDRFTVTYHPDYDSIFSPLGTALIRLEGHFPINQNIVLYGGWNIHSFNVIPDSLDMMQIHSAIIDSNYLIKILDEGGGFLQKFGSKWFNYLNGGTGLHEPTEGYYIKVTDSVNLDLVGIPVPVPFEIPLSEGWNIISYPLTESQAAMDVIQELIDINLLIKVLNESGGFIQKFGSNWFDFIGNFNPGEGYYVKVAANTSLIIDYPPNSPLIQMGPQVQTKLIKQPFKNNPYVPMNILVRNIEIPGFKPSDGDEIGVFDNGVLVGTGVINVDGDFSSNIIATHDDPSTEIVDGYTDGNTISLRYYASINPDPIELFIQPVFGQPLFSSLGTFVCDVSQFLSSTGEFTSTDISLNCYPNPANDKLNIVYMVPKGKAEISIFDNMGHLVEKHTDEFSGYESQTKVIDITSLQKGMYLIKLTFTDENSHEILMKKFIKK